MPGEPFVMLFGAPAEANAVVANFAALGELQKQDLLNFLRSL